jgi:undecaprenyl-phosphate 4-deoxy-4-formamido-L-arabinose transferase
VPVYNSQDSLLELVHRLEPVLMNSSESFELILVNDGSVDQSWQVIESLTEERDWICGLDLMRNYGQHNALLAGIRMAKYEVTITIDDDLQNPPEEIPKLLERLDSNTDVVYGKKDRAGHGFWRDIASRITKFALQSTIGVDNARNVSAYRAFRTQLREPFAHYRDPFIDIDVLLTWGSTRFASVSVKHEERAHGESNYTFFMLTRHALNMLTGFSTLPLQLASILGFTLTTFGLFVLIWVIGRFIILGGSVPGFPFLASIIAVFSGAQLFALGIIGEYLSRMHFRIMDRPSYYIRRTKQKSDGN